MMKPRASVLIGTAIQLYVRRFRYFILFPLIFGSFAVLGQSLLFSPATQALNAYLTEVLQLYTDNADPTPMVALTQAFLSQIAPTLLNVGIFAVTAGLFLNAFSTGGITRTAMNLLHGQPLDTPTQAIYGEFKWSLKWYGAALLQLIVTLAVCLLLFALIVALALISTALAAAAGVFILLGGLLLILMTNTATGLFFPLLLAEPGGFGRLIPRVWQLIKKHLGFLLVISLWLLALSFMTSLFSAATLDAVSVVINIIGIALFAPIPPIVNSILYVDLRTRAAP